MKTTIDAAGRWLIPKETRRRAGLEPGVSLDGRWRDGPIDIEPAALPMPRFLLEKLRANRQGQ